MSRRCPGDVPEMSQRCPGVVPEMSRRIPGRPPHVVSFRFRRFVFFFFSARFWSNFSNFCMFCVVFFVFLRFGIENFVAFNSFCKIPFALFAVQSVPSIFLSELFSNCLVFFFTPSLGLGGMGKQNMSLELPGFQIPLQKLFSKTHVEARALAFSQICADKCHAKIQLCIPKTKCHTKGQHKNRTHCRLDRACKLHS